MEPKKIIFIGLSLSSSWGNGHATTFRSLIKALAKRGHSIQFYERNAPWYADNRDMPDPEFADLRVYREFDDVKIEVERQALDADAIVLGSYVKDGVEIARWLTDKLGGRTPVLFYDIDTPVTLRKLSEGDFEYISPDVIPRFDAYLSFSGGKAISMLRERFEARYPVPFYCSADPDLYSREDTRQDVDLGYLGTYSDDRQPSLKALLLDVAQRLPERRFEVIGPQYPDDIAWPGNVRRVEHLPPSEHRDFYNRQRFALNITRADMRALGHSPSVRLFEAAACATPVITDHWSGIDEYFKPQEEILVARSGDDVARFLTEVDSTESARIGRNAQDAFFREHSPDRRAAQFEEIINVVRSNQPTREGAAAT